MSWPSSMWFISSIIYQIVIIALPYCHSNTNTLLPPIPQTYTLVLCPVKVVIDISPTRLTAFVRHTTARMKFRHCVNARRAVTSHVICLCILENGPLATYVKLRVAHAPEMPGTVYPPPRVSDPDMHHGTCVTHVPWCMPGSLNSGFIWSPRRGKRSRHSRPIHNPQFYVSGKRPMAFDQRNVSRIMINPQCITLYQFYFWDEIVKHFADTMFKIHFQDWKIWTWLWLYQITDWNMIFIWYLGVK